MPTNTVLLPRGIGKGKRKRPATDTEVNAGKKKKKEIVKKSIRDYQPRTCAQVPTRRIHFEPRNIK
jgi:hypothetical protein